MPATEILRRFIRPKPTRVGRVLVADDNEGVRDLLVLTLSAEGYDVVPACDGGEALDFVGSVMLGEADLDLIITDERMPYASGLDTLAAIRAFGLEIPAILITGHSGAGLSREAERLDAVLLRKPLDPSRLVAVVKSLLDGHVLRWR